MKRFTTRLLAFVLIPVVSLPVAAEFQWAPYLNAELYGGRSSFSSSDVDGLNGSLTFVPGMRVSEKLSLLPSLAYGFRKTRDVQELAGGGFLTQEQQTRSGRLKGIYALTPQWKGKAYVSHRQELVRETKDEKWGDGLFDYNKTAFGLETERDGTTWKSIRFGVDYYLTQFPNFQSLASKNFGSEIKSGEDVLDFSAWDASVAADVKVGANSLVSSYLLFSNRDFSDQKIVKLDGTFSDETRQDLFSFLSVGYRYQLPPVAFFRMGVESLTGLDVSYSLLDSDQDNYDAGQTRFNKNYYDYNEVSVGPVFNARFKEKLSVGLSYLYSRRDYADRPVQNGDGTYTPETISSDIGTFRVSLSYPLIKGLALQTIGAWQNADSNMKYESTYRYNYSSSNYFLGLTYQL